MIRNLFAAAVANSRRGSVATSRTGPSPAAGVRDLPVGFSRGPASHALRWADPGRRELDASTRGLGARASGALYLHLWQLLQQLFGRLLGGYRRDQPGALSGAARNRATRRTQSSWMIG